MRPTNEESIKRTPRLELERQCLDCNTRRFKGRRIDFTKPVEVYRNTKRDCYSVRQNGVVVAHTTLLRLVDVSFHVNEAGRQRVLKTGVKNVHAWCHGSIAELVELPRCRSVVRYNPVQMKKFTVINSDGKSHILYASEVLFHGTSLFA